MISIMDSDADDRIESSEEFWTELDKVLNTLCPTQQQIDLQLREYLQLISSYSDEFLQSEYDMVKCAIRLIESKVFMNHKSYVRRRLIGRFLKEAPNSSRLHVMTATLLYDGLENPKTFELMMDQNAFERIVQLIWKEVDQGDSGFHKLLLEIFYEMSTIQRLRLQDLTGIEDDFVKHVLEQIESGSGDPDDPYNYAVIKVLLVLNEQYMVSEHSGENEGSTLTNRVLKVLSFCGPDYKTFGENVILLLNRENETSMQLLILKLLFLLFTTSKTYEYFYTNDLCVLVDVMIRNLSDLPDEEDTLRHMYLRVFHPLLSHTQLRHPPHYKRAEILRLLNQLSNIRSQHFSPVDPTTLRLVSRCNKVEWLDDSPTEAKANNLARRYLGMSLSDVGGSSMSVVTIASLKEKSSGKVEEKKTERGAPPPPPPGRIRSTWGGLEKSSTTSLVKEAAAEVNVKPSSPLGKGSMRRRPPPPPPPIPASMNVVKVGNGNWE